MPADLTRRSLLARSAIIGCSAAASPLLTPLALAAAPWDARLVVIILRGGMDGLDVVQPWGDPEFSALRARLGAGPQNGAADLDGFFALHRGLAPLLPLWRRGELGFVHAVATPYRDKRSHFDGQDLLEAGTPALDGARDGWLNRMLQAAGAQGARTAFAIGQGEMKVLAGPAPVADWTPEATLAISPQAMELARLVMRDDPAFAAAFEEARMLSGANGMGGEDGGDAGGQDMQGGGGRRGRAHVRIAEFAAEQLRGETRVASFSINGWDTHNRQEKALGGALAALSDTILTLQKGLGGDVWGKTAVVAMTEFGRTVRVNGTGGTDHGTGGVMVLAGGAIRGGRVYGDWPGLDEASLYQRRDLMPTGDVRAPAAWIMRAMTGIGRDALQGTVFPGLDMGDDPAIMR